MLLLGSVVAHAKFRSHSTGPTLGAGTRVGGIVATGIIAYANATRFQHGIVPDHPGQALLLVGRQGIHRIEDDGLDAFLSLLPRTATMVENGIEKHSVFPDPVPVVMTVDWGR